MFTKLFINLLFRLCHFLDCFALIGLNGQPLLGVFLQQRLVVFGMLLRRFDEPFVLRNTIKISFGVVHK